MKTVDAESWMEQAACRGVDPDLFFPQRGEMTGREHEAVRVCRGCMVRIDCLEYALDNTIMYGIWGGLSERQRRRIRRQRARRVELGGAA